MSIARDHTTFGANWRGERLAVDSTAIHRSGGDFSDQKMRRRRYVANHRNSPYMRCDLRRLKRPHGARPSSPHNSGGGAGWKPALLDSPCQRPRDYILQSSTHAVNVSHLVRLQKQAGLRRRDAFDEAHAVEGVGETFQAVGLQLGDHIPAAVGHVDRSHLGKPAQGAQHRA